MLYTLDSISQLQIQYFHISFFYLVFSCHLCSLCLLCSLQQDNKISFTFLSTTFCPFHFSFLFPSSPNAFLFFSNSLPENGIAILEVAPPRPGTRSQRGKGQKKKTKRKRTDKRNKHEYLRACRTKTKNDEGVNKASLTIAAAWYKLKTDLPQTDMSNRKTSTVNVKCRIQPITETCCFSCTWREKKEKDNKNRKSEKHSAKQTRRQIPTQFLFPWKVKYVLCREKIRNTLGTKSSLITKGY